MPTPCTNCLRFHFGLCNDPPRQCRICWGWNHIERYCPSNTRNNFVRHERGEPLAGTEAWCERYGLNDDTPEDHELKFRVLQALKTNPGSAIHINGVCIYGGSSKSFAKSDHPKEQPRGRTLEERITRRDPRSLSPGRDRRRPDSRSVSSRGRRGRYRSRSHLRRRSPSPRHEPEYRARSPRYDTDSNAVVFEARDRQPENRRPENRPHHPREAGRLTLVKFNMPPMFHPLPPRPAPPAGFNSPPMYHAPLGQVSSNLPRGDGTMSDAPKQPSQPSTRSGTTLDDPYFVLGVSKSASEAE